MRGSDPASVPVRHDFVTGRSWLNFGSIGGLFGFVIVSGLAIWLLPFHVFNEVLVLLHTAVGVLAAAALAVWLLGHWLGTRKAPRRPRKISAYIGSWLLAASTVTGFAVTWQALIRPYMGQGWVQVHLWTSVLAIPFLIYHLVPASETAVFGERCGRSESRSLGRRVDRHSVFYYSNCRQLLRIRYCSRDPRVLTSKQGMPEQNWCHPTAMALTKFPGH
jgi:hypothetical protein